MKKKGLLKRKAGACTGHVSIAIPEDTIGVTGGATMMEMQQECERHFLPVYGTKAVLAQRLKQHFQEHQHHSSKEAKEYQLFLRLLSTEQEDQQGDPPVHLPLLLLHLLVTGGSQSQNQAIWGHPPHIRM